MIAAVWLSLVLKITTSLAYFYSEFGSINIIKIKDHYTQSFTRKFAAASTDDDEVVFGSPKYFLLCAMGGMASCGLTHTMVVPLDLVKTRLQVNAEKYKGLIYGLKLTVEEEGAAALYKGWVPTLIGYSAQGAFKFGLYEYFKVFYSDLVGDDNAYLYRTTLYLCASASAEVFADIALVPMEATRVRMQTIPGFPDSFVEAVTKMYNDEGINGFYKSLVPLWARQIPYTMMKFACFERTVELLYKHVVPKNREDCSKPEQLVVTFMAGYIAGVFCAIVSHPADTIVSKMNKEKDLTALEIAQKLGFQGMWKGLGTRIIMIGTLTGLQWFIYDFVKVTLKIPRPPPPEMPDSLKKKSSQSDKKK